MTSQSRIDIVLGALNLASAELKAVQKDIDALDKKGSKAGLSIGDAWKKGGAAIAAVVGTLYAAKKVFDFAAEGAQLLRLEKAGENLARSFGQSMDLLVASVQKASNGAIPEMEAIGLANRALLLGVAKTPEEFGKLTVAAAALGQAMGRTTNEALNDIITGVGRMSPLILDNLGIMTKGGKVFDEYAAKLGTTADKLTDAQKKQILLNSALESAKPLLGDNGQLVADTANAYEVLGTNIRDATDELKQQLAEAILPIVKAWNEYVGNAKEVEEHNGRLIRGMVQFADGTAMALDQAKQLWEMLDLLQQGDDRDIQRTVTFVPPDEPVPVPIDPRIVAPETFADKVTAILQQRAQDYTLAGAESAAKWVEGWMYENPGKTAAEGLQAYFDDMNASLGATNLSNTILGKLARAETDAAAVAVAAGDKSAWAEATKLSEQFGESIYVWYRQVMTAVAALKNTPVPGVPGGGSGSGTRLGGPSEHASGGPLTGFDIVGDQGMELIWNGIVIPAHLTRKLMALGLVPGRRLGLGGLVEHGGMKNYGIRTYEGAISYLGSGGVRVSSIPGVPINSWFGAQLLSEGVTYGLGAPVAGGPSSSAGAASTAAIASAAIASAAASQAAAGASAGFASQIPSAVAVQTAYMTREQRRNNESMIEEFRLIRSEIRQLNKSLSRAVRDELEARV